jgi:hypothetical protein
VSTELQVDLDPAIKRRSGTVADGARVTRTAAALEANGISVLRAADAAEAKRIVLGLIPDGSQVTTARRNRSRYRGSSMRSSGPPASTPCAHGSGVWIARPRPTRSAVCPQRPT